MKKLFSVLLSFVLIVSLSIPVFAKIEYVQIGETVQGDTVIGTSLTEMGSRAVKRDMYIGRNAEYEFHWGPLTVNGNLYIMGTFKNYGAINVSGNIICLNYYEGNSLVKRATRDLGDGNVQYFDHGRFYNYGNINSKGIIVDASYAFTDVPYVPIYSTCNHENYTEATCTEPSKCLDCGKELSPALGHVPGSPATCISSQVCTRCGTVLKEKGNHIAGLSATCTAPQTCKLCGEVLNSALGHNWSGWKTIKNPTVFKPSIEENKCFRCGKSEKRYGDVLYPTGNANHSSVVLQKKKSISSIKIVNMADGDYLVSVSPQNRKLVKISNINSRGTFKIIALRATGKTTLRAKLASGKIIKINIKVQKNAVTTTKLVVNKNKISLSIGKRFKIKATKYPFNSKSRIAFSSSNKSIATVSKNGIITGKKKGTAYITIKSGSIKKRIKVTVVNSKRPSNDFSDGL